MINSNVEFIYLFLSRMNWWLVRIIAYLCRTINVWFADFSYAHVCGQTIKQLGFLFLFCFISLLSLFPSDFGIFRFKPRAHAADINLSISTDISKVLHSIDYIYTQKKKKLQHLSIIFSASWCTLCVQVFRTSFWNGTFFFLLILFRTPYKFSNWYFKCNKRKKKKTEINILYR